MVTQPMTVEQRVKLVIGDLIVNQISLEEQVRELLEKLAAQTGEQEKPKE